MNYKIGELLFYRGSKGEFIGKLFGVLMSREDSLSHNAQKIVSYGLFLPNHEYEYQLYPEWLLDEQWVSAEVFLDDLEKGNK